MPELNSKEYAQQDFSWLLTTETMSEIDMLRRALMHIALRPTVELNPDGVDQAASSMQMVARKTLEIIKENNERSRDS